MTVDLDIRLEGGPHDGRQGSYRFFDVDGPPEFLFAYVCPVTGPNGCEFARLIRSVEDCTEGHHLNSTDPFDPRWDGQTDALMRAASTYVHDRVDRGVHVYVYGPQHARDGDGRARGREVIPRHANCRHTLTPVPELA